MLSQKRIQDGFQEWAGGPEGGNGRHKSTVTKKVKARSGGSNLSGWPGESPSIGKGAKRNKFGES